MISKIWSKLDTNTRLAVGCIALYLSLYGVVDVANFIGRMIALALM